MAKKVIMEVAVRMDSTEDGELDFSYNLPVKWALLPKEEQEEILQALKTDIQKHIQNLKS